VFQAAQNSIQNRLLAALPTEEYQRLTPYLENVTLAEGKVIYQPYAPIEYVYFPQQAIVSLVSIMDDGTTVEVGLVGDDGMVGLPVILGGETTITQAFVQVAGCGMKMKADRLSSEFDRGGRLQRLLLRYTQALLTQASQRVACNRLHTIEARLASWLLTVQDRMHSDQFHLTQEFISQMLGTRRSSVTVAAGTLSKAGIISYSRGNITVLDRQRLEAIACECYHVIHSEYERLVGARKILSDKD